MDYEFRDVRCNICDVDDFDVIGSRVCRIASSDHPKTRVVRCRRCGLIYPNPMPFADLTQMQKHYDDVDAYFPTPVDEARVAGYVDMVSQIEQALGRKGRLLDVGSGRGELLLTAKERGWDPIGFDVSLAFAKAARERSGVKVLTGTLEEQDLEPESFDAVSMVSVLHNVHDPQRALRTVWGLLKRNGVLFLEVTNDAGLLFRAADLYHRIVRDGLTSHLSPTFGGYQLYGFSGHSLRALLEKVGFDVRSTDVKGTVSPITESRNTRERLLRAGAISVMLLARATKQGAVLTATSIKS